MAKNVFGFTSEDDFERMSRSVKKSESVPQTGQRQRSKYPLGSAPTVKRAVISELGDYDVHLVTLLSGTFTEDLTTDGLEHTATQTEAYVAEEFDYHFEVGDIVLIAKISGKYWIIEAKPDCEGYCINEDYGDATDYVYGWAFRAPSLPCCPEASGVHILTTTDAGVSYESASFQCNSDGTDRTWLFSSRKLRLTPRLDDGNIEYWTNNAPSSCTEQMQWYEPNRFPSRDSSCGKMPKSICLNPLCGVGTTAGCNSLSPMQWKVTFGSGTSNPDDLPTVHTTCGNIAGTWLYQRVLDKDNADQYYWQVAKSTTSATDPGPITYNSGSGVFIFSNGIGAEYSLSAPTDCTKEVVLNNTYPTGQDCIGFPDTITLIPQGGYLEEYCYPTSIGYLIDTGTSTYTCSTVPYTLEIELAAIADGTCNQCSMLNDVHRVFLDNPNSVRWIGNTIAGNCLSSYSTTPGFFIQNSSGTLYLKFGSLTGFMNASVVYTMNVSDFNCFGTNTFSYSSADGECTNWPSTIKVYPVVSTI